MNRTEIKVRQQFNAKSTAPDALPEFVRVEQVTGDVVTLSNWSRPHFDVTVEELVAYYEPSNDPIVAYTFVASGAPTNFTRESDLMRARTSPGFAEACREAALLEREENPHAHDDKYFPDGTEKSRRSNLEIPVSHHIRLPGVR